MECRNDPPLRAPAPRRAKQRNESIAPPGASVPGDAVAFVYTIGLTA
jgi:hypothetical protein